jgi:cell division protein FtsZ
VQGISDLITIPGEVNVDFADVRAIMSGMGMALMGTGIAKGEHRAIEAAQRAISSPLLEETSIEGARGVLLNISGGDSLTLHEVAEAARIVAEAVDPDANIISGMVIDPSLEDEMKVTVIATGFKYQPDERPLPRPVQASVRLAPSMPSMPPMPPMPALAPMASSQAAAPMMAAAGEDSRRSDVADRPFYEKVLASSRGDDPGGFGPNWSSVDDYDIPAVLRKQMD